MKLQPVIGLEIHFQMKTKTKMFCRCQNVNDGAEPNRFTCPVCMGHPGTLPVLNAQALEWGLRMALAMHCDIPLLSKFDRKSYFYPDLPKGYQISQYDEPIGQGGYLIVDAKSGRRRISITRIHLEEDAAKLLHAEEKFSYVDFNRAGTPLMEIVTEPEMTAPAEAKAFLQALRQIALYLNVSNADMEKGQMRCDANISLRALS